MDEQAVQETFDSFPGLFRKSRAVAANGQPFYTLHARYAMRGDDDAETADTPSLRADVLEVLLHTIATRAQSEQASQEFERQLTETRKAARLSAAAAVVAAALALVAAIIAAYIAAGS